MTAAQGQHRLLSYTEIETALSCPARWDFAYGGRLAGSTLKARETAFGLYAGRAWGAAVAAWHQHAGELPPIPQMEAHAALKAALEQEVVEAGERGVLLPLATIVETEERLATMLDHYAATTDPLPGLTMLEHEALVPVPSRGDSSRASNRYRFQAFYDGYTVIDGQQWIVEFKLRTRLTEPTLLERQRQPRWYAWALARAQDGHAPVGVIVDERLNDLPKPPQMTEKRSRPSHTARQLCTPEAYIDVCHEWNEQPKPEVVEGLRARRWGQRFPILFSPGELAQAGQELTSAAKLIRDLDSGETFPIRNAKRMECQFCRFRDICSHPEDDVFVETLFERTVPKRLRGKEVPDGT
jgi:hypothetical protein